MDVWVVCFDPKDQPGKWTLRQQFAMHDGRVVPSIICRVKDTYEELLPGIPPGKVRLPRFPADEPQIVETWL